MKARLPVYSGAVLQEVDAIRKRSFPAPYCPNTLYKVNGRKYLYENSQGYLHIVELSKQHIEDDETRERRFIGWIVWDRYISKDGTIKETSGHFCQHKTEQEARAAMVEHWTIGNTCGKCAAFWTDPSVGASSCMCANVTQEQTQKHYTDNAPGCPWFV